MKQFFFGPSETPLLGTLHAPPAGSAGRVGVLLLYPFGNEYLRQLRAFKFLAEGIAGKGFPVLRLEVTGTGDAGGDDEDMGFERWRQDVAAGLAELQARTGVERFVLAGRRLGATLALLGAEGREGVDRLVLWDPILHGPSWLEQLRRDHEEFVTMYRGVDGNLVMPAPGTGPSHAPFEALGQGFAERLLADARALDLRRGVELAGSPRVLVLDSGPEPTLEPFAEALRGCGAGEVEFRHLPDSSARDVVNPLRVYVPAKMNRAIQAWLARDREQEQPAA